MVIQARPAPATRATPVRGEASMIVAGALLLITVVGLDLVVLERAVAEEGPPIWSIGYLGRMAVLALGSAALVVGARNLATRVLASAEPSDSRIEEWLAAAAGSSVALASVGLVVTDPGLLSRLVREDQIVEWASALLAFAAAVAFGLAARRVGRITTASALAAVTMGGGSLLLGLEEISWFQRVLDIESPEFMLNRNGQQETNLHNLATGLTGNLYYVGACIYLVLIPVVLGDRRLPSRFGWLQLVTPSRLVFYGSAAAAGFVYAMWNIAWIQATFWVTIAALLVLARDRRHRFPAVGLAAVTCLTAAAFLVAGDSMVRDWDDTEIRELVIPFGLFLGGFEAARRARTWPAGQLSVVTDR